MATWLVARGNKLDSDVEILYRPFRTLSQGEQMKVMLAVLLSGQHEFLIIDEPTNHLDFDARQTVKKYLKGKMDLFSYPMTEISWMILWIMYLC